MEFKENIEITTLCSNFEDLLMSKDFIKGIEIILKHVKFFDSKYIISLFEKLAKFLERNRDIKNGTYEKPRFASNEKENPFILDEDEIENINEVLNNQKVKKLSQQLLSNIGKKLKINITSDVENLSLFLELIKQITKDDGYEEIKKYIEEITGRTNNVIKLH